MIFSQLALKLFPQAQLPALFDIFSHLQQHQQQARACVRACVKRACTRAQYLLMREFRAGALLLLGLCGRRHVASRLRGCAAARRRAATI